MRTLTEDVTKTTVEVDVGGRLLLDEEGTAGMGLVEGRTGGVGLGNGESEERGEKDVLDYHGGL